MIAPRFLPLVALCATLMVSCQNRKKTAAKKSKPSTNTNTETRGEGGDGGDGGGQRGGGDEGRRTTDDGNRNLGTSNQIFNQNPFQQNFVDTFTDTNNFINHGSTNPDDRDRNRDRRTSNDPSRFNDSKDPVLSFRLVNDQVRMRWLNSRGVNSVESYTVDWKIANAKNGGTAYEPVVTIVMKRGSQTCTIKNFTVKTAVRNETADCS